MKRVKKFRRREGGIGYGYCSCGRAYGPQPVSCSYCGTECRE